MAEEKNLGASDATGAGDGGQTNPKVDGVEPDSIEIDDVEVEEAPDGEIVDEVEEVTEEPDPLEVAEMRILTLEEDVARVRADTYNVRQEYARYVKRAKAENAAKRREGQEDAVEALLPVLDDIEAARAAGELEGPFASIAEKLEDILQTRFGMERFGEEGDLFDPQLHDALMATPSSEVEEPTVKQVLQSGVKIGDRVLRPTKVAVETPN